MLVAKAYGARTLVVADINAARLEVAKKLGADFTILLDRKEDPFDAGKRIKETTGGAFDVSLECTGAESCSILSVESCALGKGYIIVSAL
jgi:L-iditol 2-dehydrogenase